MHTEYINDSSEQTAHFCTGKYINAYTDDGKYDAIVLLNEANGDPTTSEYEVLWKILKESISNKYADGVSYDTIRKYIDRRIEHHHLHCTAYGWQVIVQGNRDSDKNKKPAKRNIDRASIQKRLNDTNNTFSAAALAFFKEYGYNTPDQKFSEWLMEECVDAVDGPQNSKNWTPIRGKNGSLPPVGGNYRVTIKSQCKSYLSTEVCYYDDTERWFWTSKPGRVVAWEDIHFDDAPYVEYE
jgi:hypothetical protein